jgi:protein-disulfide isomerase
VLEKYPKEVKVVLMNFPLQMHAFAKKAALGALAASRQGKFVEVKDKLFANQQNLNDAKIREIARETGLNMDQFERDMKDSHLESIVARDMRQGNQAGVNSTPTVFVNGRLLSDRSIQGFVQAIESELSKKK